MRFEGALQAMREGKKVRCPSVSKNIFSFVRWSQTFYVEEYGANLHPTYSFGSCLILATDWEIVDD